ncbi:hypothetical protein PVAND_016329 [Polypedilum vanderplanki]|uniref:Uncharacterized protein n=1 Tax=Polypedilum vanderplanki TaxID=319348 RepID=A0A9J6BF55_POLVA|nr:hypothetical protein PVAND_016329 [Polypedilum vanderplanki]
MKLLSILLLNFTLVSSVDISCEFTTATWSVIDDIYECNLDSNPSITSPNTVITSVKGDHLLSKNHENVQGFYSNSEHETIFYIPHGLSKFFPHLILIYIKNGKILEIHQKDFEQYPKLRFLSLYQNEIKYLEKYLFKFNTELQYIDFGYNKINQIHPTIFDHLGQLKFLLFDKNRCIDNGEKDKSGLFELIKEVKEKCLPPNFSYFNYLEDLNRKMSNLETKIESLIKIINKKDKNIEFHNK